MMAAKKRLFSSLILACLTGQILLFATKMAMVKQVPAEEFVTNNRTVAATKLQEGDSLLTVRIAGTETDLVLQSASGMFLRFSMDEIPELKKNSRGVRGMKLGTGDELEEIYFVTQQPQIVYKEKEVHLNRLKLAKRDGKGARSACKIRLSRAVVFILWKMSLYNIQNVFF